MPRKTTSYRLPEITLNQLKKLTTSTGSSDANVITLAIDRMYREETQIMTTNLKKLAQQFGTVTHEGTEYTLTSVADFSSRLFDGNGLNAQEGEPYTVEFSCPAVDSEGNEYWIYWQFDNIIKGEEPAPDAYDWAHGDDHITRIAPA